MWTLRHLKAHPGRELRKGEWLLSKVLSIRVHDAYCKHVLVAAHARVGKIFFSESYCQYLYTTCSATEALASRPET